MKTRTVFVISSDDLGWTDLRSALHSIAMARIVGEATSAQQAVRLAKESRPDIIITSSRLDGTSSLPILRALHQVLHPFPALAVFAAQFRLDEAVAFAEFGVTSYLIWSDLSVAALRHCLAAIIVGNTSVQSRLATYPASRTASPLHNRWILLTERERFVLQHLAAGETREQIAATAHLSLRTVNRTITQLEEKLEAPCPFVLGMNATLLGVIP